MEVINLVEQILKYPRPWILTGAGISTESGIPDFRSSGGMWEQVDPIENFSTWALYNNPKGLYVHGLPMFTQVLEAEPNDGHKIVGELQNKRLLGPIITQNVDSLHQKGGAKWVYEIHGHIRSATCLNCQANITMEQLFEIVDTGDIPPTCECGGIFKPDVILFGDSMPDDFQDAIKLIRSFNTTDNMIIVIGSSLTVSPINSFPYEFEKLAIINNSGTALDNRAELIITATAGDTMNLVKEKLIEFNGGKELKTLPAGFIPGRLANLVVDMGQYIKNQKKSFTKKDSGIIKLTADIFLLEKFFTNYPNYDNRPALEKYLIDYSLKLIKTVQEQLNIKDSHNNPAGFILKSLNDIITSYYEALKRYTKQANNSQDVIGELALQTLGLIGLYRYLSLLANSPLDNYVEKELINQVIEIIKPYNFNINLELALNDF
ncbi:MAG: hypothetical protein GX333_01085 [Syntrophomonadaceae bacterium]|nr:hypothetical protein [Syntrophomonadaceae bacterium]